MAKEYQPTIGLEIHAELKTVTKMFCGCPNPAFAKATAGKPSEPAPNSTVCPVCLGLPGSLPFANEAAIVKSYLIARALGCNLADRTYWERKNYFYPDLPKGYQISQYNLPIGTKGKLAQVTVRRVHLEEDTGKLLHPAGADYSLVDYNRSGVPLVELVTEPEITTAKQAAQFAKEYQLVLRYLDVSDADMEKGQLRVEANISVNMGTKVEVKNLNSFRAVERAIDFEIQRQTGLLRKGEQVIQETRGWDEVNQKTLPQRVKETESDYRYFPEPDLPPISSELKTKAHAVRLPELPDQKRATLAKLKIPVQYHEVLIAEPSLISRFEKLAKQLSEQRSQLANLLINKPQTRSLPDRELLKLARLPDYQLKRFLKGEVIERVSTHVADEDLTRYVNEVITEQTKAIADYRAGKQNVFGFLIGQVMKKQPQLDPNKVAQVLHSHLK